MKFIKHVVSFIPQPFRKRRYALLAVFLLVALWFLTKDAPNYALVKTQVVRREAIESVVTASGDISSAHNADLHFPFAGKVNWVNVKEGDQVKEGTFLVSLDKEKIENALRQATQDFIAAKAAVEKVYDATGRKTAESFDEKISRTAAEATQNKAYDAMRLAQENLKQAVIYAPFDGTVVEIATFVGDEVGITDTVIKVVDLSSIRFISEVDESDIGKIFVGEPASITLDAYPGKTIEATVSRIGQEKVTTSTGATAFPVEFNLLPVVTYRIGMNGEAKIVSEKRENAIVVPNEAIVDESSVYVSDSAGYHKVPVEEGISSDSSVEIVKGLAEGTRVVVSGFDELGKKSILDKLLGK